MKVLLIGNFGAGNYGDEMILIAFLERFLHEMPGVEVGIVSANEKLSRVFLAEFFGEEELSRVSFVKPIPFGFRSILKHWKGSESVRKIYGEYDLAIYCGGGLFSDEESRISVPMWAAYGLLFKQYKKPIFSFGVGFGPFRYALSKKMMSMLLPHFSFCGVRDHSSAEAVASFLGDKSSARICVTGDSVFLLDPKKLSEVVRKKQPQLKNYIVFSMRPWRWLNEELYKKVARALDGFVQQNNVRVVLMSFQKSPQNDEVILNKISAHILNKEQVFVSSRSDSLLDNLSVLAGAKLTVALRLHANLLSAVLGVPFVVVPYAQKGVSASVAFGAPTIDFRMLSGPDELTKALTQLAKDCETILIGEKSRIAEFNHIAGVGFKDFLAKLRNKEL